MPPLGSVGPTGLLLQWGFEEQQDSASVVVLERVIRYRLECMEQVICFRSCRVHAAGHPPSIVSCAWSGSSAIVENGAGHPLLSCDCFCVIFLDFDSQNIFPIECNIMVSLVVFRFPGKHTTYPS